ncbi:MAG: hypothetical protein K6T55_03840 [Syntrophobacterales bacterium]|nr:hypothetical protein [Syntrophobacterales bacterium]
MSGKIDHYLPYLEAGPSTTFRNLTLWPLFYEAVPALPYVSLDTAVEQDLLEITEISEEGMVPHIRIVNRGKTPVLLLAGEEVVGAKQNRILNTTIMVPGEAKLTVPVSCVEQGRWSYQGREFTSERRVCAPRLKAKVQGQVNRSLNFGQGYRADQMEVWEEVRLKADRLKVSTRTLAMADIYRSYEDELQQFTRNFPLVPHQKGFLAAIQGQPAGLEAFDSEENLTRYYAKLLKSYALDAVEALHSRMPRPASSRWRNGTDFLQELLSLEVSLRPSLGLGEDLRVEGETIVGAGLVCLGALVYLSLFPKLDGERQGSLASPRRRARMV